MNRKSSPRLTGMILLITLLWGCSHMKPYIKEGGRSSPPLHYDREAVIDRILLTGDAGYPQPGNRVFELLRKWAAYVPRKTKIIFLGDNIYPDGMPPADDPGREKAERKILTQISAVRDSGASCLFIAGNHDWRRNLDGLKREADFISREIGSDRVFLPPPGLPGPVHVDLESLRLVIIDSSLWVDDSLGKAAEIPSIDWVAVSTSLESLLSSAGERRILFVAHHPIETHGAHGGFFTWTDHVFPLRKLAKWLWIPLPVLGSLYPMVRRYIVKSSQDLNSRGYRNMQQKLGKVLSTKKPLIYAAGHDHSLQVMTGGKAVEYILVSGAALPDKISHVSHGENTLFAHEHTGFMAVDFLSNHDIWMYVIEPGDQEIVFSRKIFSDTPLASGKEALFRE